MATRTKRRSTSTNGASKGDGATATSERALEAGAAARETVAEAVAGLQLAAGATKPPDFTSAIYDAITKVFASKNPTQLFCLCWPGTVLDYDRMKWEKSEETGGNMPEAALIRSSQILDQYVPPAPLTQPDGSRVSDRYGQALSQLGPRPNATLLELQAIIRQRLQVQVTREVDGEERVFSLAGWFDYLYARWADAKRAWAEKQQQMREYFKQEYLNDPNHDAWWNAYLQWYGDNADAYISRINGRWQQLVAEFPLTEWEDAIAILDTKDGAGLQEARQILQNSIRPVPYQEGLDFVPTQGVPYDWPLEIKPVTKFLDLLADPDAQQMAYETAIAQLEQEIFNWTAIIPQIDDEGIQRDVAALSSARKSYSEAQSALLQQYTANTVEAVKMYCDIMKSRGQLLSGVTDQNEQTKITDDVNGTAKDLTEGKKDQPPFAPVDWDQIKDIAGKIGEGQNSLIEKQQALIDTGLALADAADKFLSDKTRQSSYAWLRGYIEQLRSKLAAVQRKSEDFGSAANVWYRYRSDAKTDSSNTDPNASPSFGKDAYPSPLDSPANDRWTLVQATVDTSQLDSSTTMNTSFSATQWGVDLFFGSAGGMSQSQKSSFASDFMQSNSSIQIGFLATKVLIERPWMKPEVFGQTRNMFRTTSTRVSPDWQITAEDLLERGGGLERGGEDLIKKLIDDYSFPSYPVAGLLVKDVTVRVQIKFNKMSDMREYAKSVSSQGGGFLCFSVSRSQSSESQSESTNEYCMAGQFVAKAPAPQIIGYWVQFLPPDESQELTPQDASEIAASLGFINKLQTAHQAGEEVAEPGRG